MTYTPMDPIGKTNLILDLTAQKQKAISGNLTNIDTPGYVRKDIDFSQYLGTMDSPLETELSSKLGPSAVILEQQQGVNVNQELTEMHKNSMLYAVAARRMSGIITEMKTVINVGK